MTVNVPKLSCTLDNLDHSFINFGFPPFVILANCQMQSLKIGTMGYLQHHNLHINKQGKTRF